MGSPAAPDGAASPVVVESANVVTTAVRTMTAPVATGERMDVLDAIRGVAVLGILVINVVALSGYAFVPPPAAAGSQYDARTFFVLSWLIEGKFYALFSFLFGVGFSVFVQRAAARGADPAQLFRRRLLALMLIGFIHTTFIWMGDILLTYAVIGFGLVPFLKKSDRTVIRWSVSMFALPIVLFALAVVAVALFGGSSGGTAPAAVGPAAAAPPVPPFMQHAVDSFANGGYVDVVRGNVIFTVANIIRRLVLMFFPRVFGMFLLGLYVGRKNMFGELAAHRPLLVRTLAVGLLAGLPLAFIGATLEQGALPVPGVRGLIETTAKSVSIPALALAYAAGLCLLFQCWRPVMAAFAPVGRMALTSYLTHSVVGTGVFYGLGLGLFGKVSLTVSVVGALVFYVVQMVISRLWLSRAQFGPAEWLWRMLTYRRRFALLKGPDPKFRFDVQNGA